ncbi:acyltransferase family protein [Pseudomonas putida]
MLRQGAGRFIFLDYLRIFAFVSVLVGHKFYKELGAAAADPQLHITLRYFLAGLEPLYTGGAAGVVVFFLTSGYIITHVLQQESALDFAVKRVFRIYPLYMVAILAEALGYYFFRDAKWPSLSLLVPRLLLIGDFFATPNALSGVEWTLRIEVLFYAFMALAKKLGLFRRQPVLPFGYLAVALLLFMAPPFPFAGQWNAGYVTSYSLFLFIGSLIYLSQQRLANRALCVGTCGVLFYLFLSEIAQLQPGWKESNYAILAVVIFLVARAMQHRLQDSAALRLASNMTFSVYLFHNWLWSFLAVPVALTGLAGLPAKFVIGLLLLVICYGLHATVERGGLALGRAVLARLNRVGLATAERERLHGKAA